jgi:hypothetical protein
MASRRLFLQAPVLWAALPLNGYSYRVVAG